jgi:hypothetical protein
MDAQLPNANVPEESRPNVPEESKASDPNQQLSDTDLNGVVGGVKKPTAPPKDGYLTVIMQDVLISD